MKKAQEVGGSCTEHEAAYYLKVDGDHLKRHVVRNPKAVTTIFKKRDKTTNQ